MVMVKNRKTMRRKVPVFRVIAEPGADYSTLTTAPEIQQVVLDEAIYAIKDGIEKHKSSISLFEIADSEYYIELSKDKWKPILEHLIDHYVKKEEYDKCAEVRDLISKL
jgi:hypothetical protein